MRFQSLFGVIPTIKGKGFAAKAVADMLVRMRRELGEQDEEGQEPEVDELILIDRETDMITPMLTQLTYEGLIDDTYGLNNGIVELPAHLLSTSASSAAHSAQVSPCLLSRLLSSHYTVARCRRRHSCCGVAPLSVCLPLFPLRPSVARAISPALVVVLDVQLLPPSAFPRPPFQTATSRRRTAHEHWRPRPKSESLNNACSWPATRVVRGNPETQDRSGAARSRKRTGRRRTAGPRPWRVRGEVGEEQD
jgi:hypothetical protein